MQPLITENNVHASTLNPYNQTQTQDPNFQNTNQTPNIHISQLKDAQSEEKLQLLEKRLRAIEGTDCYNFNVNDLCLVPNVMIPPKFKIPEFDKYKGDTCPKNHLTMYCRKMTACSRDDKLLIHFFQESLTGAALIWYMNLKRGPIRTWKDLAEAFMKQYRYNMDMAPDRTQLQNMVKNDKESFKEYAQHWREVAAQVQPPLSDKEMVAIFIDTLQSPFYDKMIGTASSNFSDLVAIGDMVEMGMKKGKIAPIGQAKQEEGETQVIMSCLGKSSHHSHTNLKSYHPPTNYQLDHSPTSLQQPFQIPCIPYPYVATTSQVSQPYYPGIPFRPSHLTQTPITIPYQPNQQWNNSSHPSQSKQSLNQERKDDHIRMTSPPSQLNDCHLPNEACRLRC